MVADFDYELVIGLVSAVGTETKQVVELLTERLELAGYSVLTVKISKDIIPLLSHPMEKEVSDYDRVRKLMDAGNSARELTNNDAILSLGAAAEIYSKRPRNDEGKPNETAKKAYIIDSLKRPEEVREMRLIYPAGFVLVGVHSDETRRREHLISNRGMTKENADELIKRDSDEVDVKHGQRVNRTFHMADFFVRVSKSHDQLRSDICRMVSLWFGNPFATPTFDEHAMFMAFGAALRSADMSRQVGAVVTRDSQILAMGANDCPRAGGGLYWPARDEKSGAIEDAANGRDFMRPDGDSNRAEQFRIIDQIVRAGEKKGINAEELRKLLETSPLRDLTE